jgi:hypothetical protein
MPNSKPAPRPLVSARPPTCSKCQIFTDVLPIIIGLGHLAGRIFECRQCREIQVLPEGAGHMPKVK